jgi:hypothetical protein
MAINKDKRNLYKNLEAIFLENSYGEVISLWEANSYVIDYVKETSLVELLAVSYIENNKLHIALDLVNKKLILLKKNISAFELNKDLKDDFNMFLLLQVEIYQKLNLNLKALIVLYKYEKYFENKDHFRKQITHSLENLAISVSNVYWKIGFFIVVLIVLALVLKHLGIKSFLLNIPYILLLFYTIGYFFRNIIYNIILKKFIPQRSSESVTASDE